MKKILLTLFLAASLSLSAQPLWLRHNVISPLGDKIAFCYKGDIYVVNANGGKALQITTNASYESEPVWSPDGKQSLSPPTATATSMCIWWLPKVVCLNALRPIRPRRCLWPSLPMARRFISPPKSRKPLKMCSLRRDGLPNCIR